MGFEPEKERIERKKVIKTRNPAKRAKLEKSIGRAWFWAQWPTRVGDPVRKCLRGGGPCVISPPLRCLYTRRGDDAARRERSGGSTIGRSQTATDFGPHCIPAQRHPCWSSWWRSRGEPEATDMRPAVVLRRAPSLYRTSSMRHIGDATARSSPSRCYRAAPQAREASAP